MESSRCTVSGSSSYGLDSAHPGRVEPPSSCRPVYGSLTEGMILMRRRFRPGTTIYLMLALFSLLGSSVGSRVHAHERPSLPTPRAFTSARFTTAYLYGNEVYQVVDGVIESPSRLYMRFTPIENSSMGTSAYEYIAYDGVIYQRVGDNPRWHAKFREPGMDPTVVWPTTFEPLDQRVGWEDLTSATMTQLPTTTIDTIPVDHYQFWIEPIAAPEEDPAQLLSIKLDAFLGQQSGYVEQYQLTWLPGDHLSGATMDDPSWASFEQVTRLSDFDNPKLRVLLPASVEGESSPGGTQEQE